MPKPFNQLMAVAAPIMRGNIDTDVIIRIERLSEIPFAARLANGRLARCVICRMVRKIPNSS